METNTQGGAYVQGDAKAGGAFTGRDYQKFEGGVILNFDDQKEPQANVSEHVLRELVEKVNRLLIIIDGDSKYDGPGLRLKVTALEESCKAQAQRIELLANWNRIILIIATLSAAGSAWAILVK